MKYRGVQEKEPRPAYPPVPQWYCVKTVFHRNGKMESEIVADKATKLAIVIQQEKKPLDGAFEKNGCLTYYTYYEGYKEAMAAMA